MNKSKNIFVSALIGTILTAICCFTPVLVIAAGAIGLSMLIPYLDLALFPALGILFIITVVSYIRWKKADRKR